MANSYVSAISAVLAMACFGCYSITPLDVKRDPELCSVLVCKISAHDRSSPDHVKRGAAVCARTRDGRYTVITVGHLAFAANEPTELEFSKIDPAFGNVLGLYHSLKPYIAEIHDVPELDLTIYVLKQPIEDVPFADIASDIPDRADVTASGVEDVPTYGLAFRKLEGKLNGKSMDQKALSLVLHTHAGDSGGGVFLHGHLIGTIQGVRSGGIPSTIRVPFYCVFSEPQTRIVYDPAGIPIQNDTIAIAITEEIIATAIKHSSTTAFPASAVNRE